jgi:hypothetical protein
MCSVRIARELVRTAAQVSASISVELRKRQQHVELVERQPPIEFAVSNCWVTETIGRACALKVSTSRAKSASERVSRSTL